MVSGGYIGNEVDSQTFLGGPPCNSSLSLNMSFSWSNWAILGLYKIFISSRIHVNFPMGLSMVNILVRNETKEFRVCVKSVP